MLNFLIAGLSLNPKCADSLYRSIGSRNDLSQKINSGARIFGSL